MQMLSRGWERAGLAVARVIIGILWLTQAAWKLPPTFGCPPDFATSTDLVHRTTGLCDWTGLMGVFSIFPPHQWFVQHVIIPNLSWAGWLIFLGEVFLAVSLILGLLTRLGGLLGLLMALNLLLGLWNVPHEWYWTYIMLMALQWGFLVTAAGRALGVDARLVAWLQPKAAAGDRVAQALLWLM